MTRLAIVLLVGAASGLVAAAVDLRFRDRKTWWRSLLVIVAINVAYQFGLSQ